MKFHGMLCGLLLLLCVTAASSSVGTPQRHILSDASPFNPVSVSGFTPEGIIHSTPAPPVISTPPPPVMTPPHPGSGSGSSGNPVGNWFKCAKQFELVVFSVKEIYVTNFTSEIFSLETNQLIGLAAGNCPNLEGTESPTGSGAELQACVFTYELFNRGRFVETGTFDPSPNGVSNNAVTGIDGEFFQALGLEHIQNFPDATGAIDTFYICEVKTNSCPRDNHQHNNQHDRDNDKEHNGHN